MSQNREEDLEGMYFSEVDIAMHLRNPNAKQLSEHLNSYINHAHEIGQAVRGDYVCVIKHRIYGTSGTELMPPVEETRQYGYLSHPGENREAFSERMAGLVLPFRRKSDSEPRRDYSERDSWGWATYELKHLPQGLHSAD